MNNINAITDNHRDNRLDCELNHHGYPIQVRQQSYIIQSLFTSSNIPKVTTRVVVRVFCDSPKCR